MSVVSQSGPVQCMESTSYLVEYVPFSSSSPLLSVHQFIWKGIVFHITCCCSCFAFVFIHLWQCGSFLVCFHFILPSVFFLYLLLCERVLHPTDCCFSILSSLDAAFSFRISLDAQRQKQGTLWIPGPLSLCIAIALVRSLSDQQRVSELRAMLNQLCFVPDDQSSLRWCYILINRRNSTRLMPDDKMIMIFS